MARGPKNNAAVQSAQTIPASSRVRGQVPVQRSLVTCAAACIFIYILLLALRDVFLSSNPLKVAAGAVAAVFFFFAFMGVANLKQILFGAKSAGWFEAVLAIALTVPTAANVHGIAATTSVFFSGCMLAYISWGTGEIHKVA